MDVIVDYKEIESLNNKLDAFGKALTGLDLVEQLAQKAKDLIYIRTFSHKDFKGNAFKPYTIRYANEKGVGKSEVNLYSINTGMHMLDDMIAEALSPYHGQIAFKTEKKAKLAKMHNTGDIKGGKKREFFALSDSDNSKILSDYQDIINEKKRGLGLA